MRHDKRRTTRQECLKCFLNFQLRIGVDTCCRFIQYEYTRIGEQRSCKGNQLALPHGQDITALLHLCIVAIWQQCNKVMRMNSLSNLLDLIICGI
ncbi:hypothetical protein D3C85_1567540 [compost metagenome]